MSSSVKERNSTVDILRGIAMLMVILGHTMAGCTENSQDSFLYNIVWTLQMPLFILISGYVTKYSRGVDSLAGLWNYIKRRTVSYILPWIVWSFLIRGVIFRQTSFLNIGWLVYHMDSGYWFLFTIWTITIIFGLSEYIGKVIAHRKNLYFRVFMTAMIYLIGMAMLTVIGVVMGLSFLGIKLTLYYMPFYFAGYLYGQFAENILQTKYGEKLKEALVAVCLLVWLFLMNRYNFYSIGDSGFGIIIRALASVAGCIAICSLMSKLCNSKSLTNNAGGGYSATVCRRAFTGNLPCSLSGFIYGEDGNAASDADTTGCTSDICKLCVNCKSFYACNENDKSEPIFEKDSIWKKYLSWVGQCSLELYVVHGFCLNPLNIKTAPEFMSIEGISLMIISYLISVIISSAIVLIIDQNIIVRRFVNGKSR